MSAEIKIRFMEEKDLERVVFLERACFSKPWSEKSFSDALHAKDTLYLVAESEKQVMGYCGFFLAYESADLCNMCVEKGIRRQGIGRQMLERAFSLLKERQTETVLLEVRVSNTPASSLYQKLGFEKIGIRKEYYSEPLEDAVLMQKKIN